MTYVSQMRSAALLLHSLSPTDQGKILADLDSVHQQSLRRLLAELRDLGISGDSHFINQVLASQQNKTTPTPSMVGTQESVAQLNIDQTTALSIEQLADQYGEEQLSRELSVEDTIVIAALIHESSCADKLLQRMNPLQNKRIRAQFQTWREHQGVPPLLREVALRSFALKLQNLAASAQPKRASNRSFPKFADLISSWKAITHRWKGNSMKRFLSERRI